MARNCLNRMLETALRSGRIFRARTVVHAVHVSMLAVLVPLSLGQSASAQAPSAAAEYSLIVGVATSTMPGTEPVPCPDAANCFDTISFGDFGNVTTLAGPDLGESFGAQIVTHTRMMGQPLLMLVKRLPDGELFVLDYGRGPTAGGEACLRAETFQQIAWQPDGEGFATENGRICAGVPAGAALYGDPVPVDKIDVADAPSFRKAPRASITKPHGEWGDLYLVVMDLKNGKRHPTKIFVPEDCRAEEEPALCLYGTIIVHPIAGAEVVAATTKRRFNTDNPRRIETPGPHAASGASGARVVALAERTDEGYWWVPWKSKVERGKACVPKWVMDEFAINFGPRAVSERDGETCFVI